MKEFLTKYKLFIILAISVVVFAVYTILVKYVDVQAIGPINPATGEASSVGFATMNGWFRDLIGNHLTLYTITDLASFLTVPLGTIFFVMGIVQWIQRKNMFKVDYNILALGCCYSLTGLTYLAFQFIEINYRAVVLEVGGEMVLELSYPSSTTILGLVLLLTAIDQSFIYIKNDKAKTWLKVIEIAFSLFLVVGRIISGVHWTSDIIGGVLASFVLLTSYMTFKVLFKKIQSK